MNKPARIDEEQLRKYFVGHLDRIYCAKTHLIERLPEAAQAATFKELNLAVNETIDDVELQMERMDEIFTLLGSASKNATCNGMAALLDEAFEAIHDPSADEAIRDLSILFYLQNIESIEMASFQVLQMAAVRFHNPNISLLLKINYNEAKEDRALMLLLTAKYLIN